MPIVSQIESDLATAMKDGVADQVSVLRLIKNSLQAENKKLAHDLSDDEAIKVLQREAKQRKDSIDQYTKGGRRDLADAEQQELAIIESYLPEQMSEEELASLVDKVVAETGASGLAQIGVVIGAVMKEAGGAADGSTVSRLVRAKLT
ncbi:MAG TPA: GatB/YqeY domain-containing protein [Candidatus Saccharimonadales bacterium]|nr:GatB/YqeY domain-containing protein [Candidatus Saccharimonadales bacterium]